MAVGGGDEYLWLGSTDHGDGTMYRGYSAALDEAPTSWTTFQPPGGFTSPETPHFVYDPTETRPFRLYYHPQHSDSGGVQQTRLASYATDWTSGTDEGEVLPATENIGALLLNHTGYAYVERRSATDWHAWSLVRSSTPARYGYWTSATGEPSFDCINDDLDLTSMVPAGRMLAGGSINRFVIGATTYAVTMERDDDAPGGGAAAPNSTVVLCEMPDEVTFTNVETIWTPADNGVHDNISAIRAVQDPDDATLIHLYVHIAGLSVFYATHTVT